VVLPEDRTVLKPAQQDECGPPRGRAPREPKIPENSGVRLVGTARPPSLRATRHSDTVASRTTLRWSSMRKYLHVINVGIQNNLTYRFNFLARSIFGLIPLIAILYVWKTIYSGKRLTVEGRRLHPRRNDLLLPAHHRRRCVDGGDEDDWQIASDIKDGAISQFSAQANRLPLVPSLACFVSGRVTYLAVAVAPLALFILYLRHYLVLPPDWTALACFLLSTILTALLQFFMSYTMAMLAFWVLEVSTFIFHPLLRSSTLPAGTCFLSTSCPTAWNECSFSLLFPISSISRSAFTWAKPPAGTWLPGC